MGAKVRKINGSWVLVVHHEGKRTKRAFGSTTKDKRAAEEAARRVNAELVRSQYAEPEPEPEPQPEPVPFDQFARAWLRREVEIPIERSSEGHHAPASLRVYRNQIETHLVPYFAKRDIRRVRVSDVQGFRDHCVDIGRPRSAKSIDMALNVLSMILTHAQGQELVETNAVQRWKTNRTRRRASSTPRVAPEKVLSADELACVLEVARDHQPKFYPLILFLADTGCRIGEAVALRWIDVDLEEGTARICRSFSSGEHLGPTKTGRERVIELSSRLRCELLDLLPNVYPPPEDALVFPGIRGQFLSARHLREKVFKRLVREALGKARRHSLHDLRHTWASLHMARGTPLKWIQEQGGWTTAKILLDVYGHYVPSESRGFADVLTTAPDGPIRPSAPESADGDLSADLDSEMESDGYDQPPSASSPRSPIMHFTLPPPFL